MAAFHWYSDTPTVMSQGGTTTYIYPTPEMKAALKKDAADWVAKAETDGTPITVVYRAAVATMLEGVDPKAITAAKLDPLTTDVAAPVAGTAEAKALAVAEKLNAVVPVDEYRKLAALQATVVKAESVDEKPIERQRA